MRVLQDYILSTVSYPKQLHSDKLAPWWMQGQLPCLTQDGKVIMPTPHSIARAPDGNGGVYIALEKWVTYERNA